MAIPCAALGGEGRGALQMFLNILGSVVMKGVIVVVDDPLFGFGVWRCFFRPIRLAFLMMLR